MGLVEKMLRLHTATTWWLVHKLEDNCFEMPIDGTTVLLLCDMERVDRCALTCNFQDAICFYIVQYSLKY